MYPTNYRAIVYLSPFELNGEKKSPACYTETTVSKERLSQYCKLLIEKGIAVAYRITQQYSEGGSWYNNTEVVYLPDDVKPLSMNNLTLSIS